MKFSGHCTNPAGRRRFAQRSAFTLLEVIVASACGALVLGSFMVFLLFARVSLSGIAAQAMVSDTAGRTVEFMQSRIRLADYISVDSTGNTLTLAFDDNPAVDSDIPPDGNPYNDKDHYEVFQFNGTNGTNSATAAGNSLTYKPNRALPGTIVLVSAGVRNLPGNNIFANPSTSTSTVLIRFGIVDTNTRDRFQSIDIQAMGVALNINP